MGFGAVERMMPDADAPGQAGGDFPNMPALTFTGVGKTYTSTAGDITALQDITFSIREGEFVSIVGPSGCGKSTLLKLVAGVIRPSSGTIAVPRAAEGTRGTAGRLGMVFQTPVLMPWRDVLSNVMLPFEILRLDQRKGRKRAREMLALVGLAGFERRFPWELSGGMQQRVAISRALVFNPTLLLMDEPFGALDALTREEMGTELLRIWEETRKTILFVTHSIDEAVFLSDRVVVMSARPGTIALVTPIELPRPRDAKVRYHPQFTHYCEQLRDTVFTRRP